MSKIGVLVLSCSHQDYSAFKTAQAKSWINDFLNVGIMVYFVEGVLSNSSTLQFSNIPDYSIDGHLISVQCDDTLNDSFAKTLAGLDALFSVDGCDVVLRTNLSSFLDISNFLKYIDVNKVGNSTYSGVVGKTTVSKELAYTKSNRLLTKLYTHLPMPYQTRREFASGACYFIGAKVFSHICLSKNFLNLIDDVAISHAGAYKFLVKSAFPRIWVNSLSRGVNDSTLADFNRDKGFHYRFKSPYRDIDALLLASFGDPKFRSFWLKEHA
jgi:hypothetical protein